MADEKVVQENTDSVQSDTQSVQGEVSTEETIPKPEPLTEEKVAQLVEERVEIIARKFQSEKDRAIAQSQREAREAQSRAMQSEQALGAYKGKVSELDPEVGASLRLAELEQREKYYQGREGEESQRQQALAFDTTFNANMSQFITDAGLDPADKKIDWGNDTMDYLSRQQKILASVNKIQKENVKVSKDRQTQEFADFKAELRKELNLDSVDTSVDAGVPGKLTIEQVKKMSPEEKEKRASEIAKLPLGLG